jgi:glycosyltransferase involved in cell wall biosynthesis
VLFLNVHELGFTTTCRTIQHYSALHPGIDAYHVNSRLSGWRRVGGATVGHRLRGWDFQGLRLMATWRLYYQAAIFPRLRPLDRFDVIHIMTQQRGAALLGLRNRTRAKFAVNLDAPTAEFYRQVERSRPWLDLDVMLEQRVFNAADAVIAASQWAADAVERDHGVERSRIVIGKHCAVRAERTPVRDHAGAALRGTPGHAPVRIVFVGNDWLRKGGHKVLAWHQARWADRCEFHVCSARAPVDRSARNVIWHGATPHDTLINEVLPSCDLMAMPTWNDTFMVAAQEAQAAGLPVVTSAMCGIPEVVRGGVTGFLRERADEAGFVADIERLLDDPGLRAHMGRAAAEHARRDLNPDVWHVHMLDQLVALGRGQPLRRAPAGVWVRD